MTTGPAGALGSGRMTTDSPTDLHTLADELLEKATSEHSGRAGRTLPHPVDGLRQTVIALRAGAELGDHESPGPASLLVLRGRLRLVSGEESVSLTAHLFSPVPARRHSLHAEEDSVVLLSVAVPDRAPQAD
jgi:quercetin dioxygenase-like cupin family protein